MKATRLSFVQLHSLWAFFLLTYALNILIVVAQLYILKIPQTQAVALLQVFTPTISALILSATIGGKIEVLKLFSALPSGGLAYGGT
jgi:hypothetical protein